MIEHAKASKATTGVKIMAGAAAGDARACADEGCQERRRHPRSRPRSPSRFSDNTTLTIVRTSVDIKPDMCIWRGTVEGPDAPVTLMWWPDGKMTGTVQQQGRIYSIRHLGGEMLRGGRDGRGPDAAGACADARAPAQQRPQPARRSAGRSRATPACLRPKVTAGHAHARSSRARSDEAAAGGRRRQKAAPRSQGHRHRRDRRLHQEGGEPTTPTSSASSSTSPSRRPTSRSA